MKKSKLTAISLMFATLAATATLGATSLNANVTASADAETFALADVFYVSASDVLGAKNVGEDKVTAFTLADEEEAMMKRSLALKWYEEDAENKGQGVAKYFNAKFALQDTNFTKLQVSMDTKSAWATKDEKATNTLTFTKNADGSLAVNLNEEATAATIIAADTTKQMTLALGAGAKDGQFSVELSVGENVYSLGYFENIGANYAEYNYSNKAYPFAFKAELPENAAEDKKETVVLLYEVNAQKFTGISNDNKVTDTAAPVLVVNEQVDGFLRGTAFSLDYKAIDVLKTSNVKPNLEFYQYDPAVEAGKETYSTLSTSTYFHDTTYYVKDGSVVEAGTDGAEKTSVYEKEGKEFVAIRATLEDATFTKSDGTAPVCNLAWYANAGRTEKKGDIEYLIIDDNEDGATYKSYVTLDNTNKVNVFDKEAFEKDPAVIAFKESLAEAANDVYAGSNSYIYFPSFEWFIGDNNGYRNLKFTISYKNLSSSTASNSSSLSYSALKLSVAAEGLYEFKIFANDKAGNTMKYYLDGELVSVTTGNIWEIEEIPTFTFNIANKGLKVEDPDSASKRRDTEILNKTYTMDSLTVIGAVNLQEDYSLYQVDLIGYNASVTADKKIQQSALSSVTYDALAKAVDYASVKNGDYFTAYLDAYISLIIKDTAAVADEVKPFFKRILKEEDCETEAQWKESEKYEWSSATKSFETVEVGTYLILADYWEQELPQVAGQRTTAYMVVTVQSEADVIKGDSNWLQNNVVSVVLFSIAGVMLILIIILLLVKPSDESVEDLDDTNGKTKVKKEKKDKK